MERVNFEHQVVVVTGAASGLGLGTAQALHAAGANVVLGDVREDARRTAMAGFADPSRLARAIVDVRIEASIADLVAFAERTFGPISIMIANAGIVPNASVLNMDSAA